MNSEELAEKEKGKNRASAELAELGDVGDPKKVTYPILDAYAAYTSLLGEGYNFERKFTFNANKRNIKYIFSRNSPDKEWIHFKLDQLLGNSAEMKFARAYEKSITTSQEKSKEIKINIDKLKDLFSKKEETQTENPEREGLIKNTRFLLSKLKVHVLPDVHSDLSEYKVGDYILDESTLKADIKFSYEANKEHIKINLKAERIKFYYIANKELVEINLDEDEDERIEIKNKINELKKLHSEENETQTENSGREEQIENLELSLSQLKVQVLSDTPSDLSKYKEGDYILVRSALKTGRKIFFYVRELAEINLDYEGTGWKLHISVDETDDEKLNTAWDIVREQIVEQRMPAGKIISTISTDNEGKFEDSDGYYFGNFAGQHIYSTIDGREYTSSGKTFCIYLGPNSVVEKYKQRIAKFIYTVAAELHAKDIKPGFEVSSDQPLPGCPYFYYRNDTTPEGFYLISHPKEHRFNLGGHEDLIHSIKEHLPDDFSLGEFSSKPSLTSLKVENFEELVKKRKASSSFDITKNISKQEIAVAPKIKDNESPDKALPKTRSLITSKKSPYDSNIICVLSREFVLKLAQLNREVNKQDKNCMASAKWELDDGGPEAGICLNDKSALWLSQSLDRFGIFNIDKAEISNGNQSDKDKEKHFSRLLIGILLLYNNQCFDRDINKFFDDVFERNSGENSHINSPLLELKRKL